MAVLSSECLYVVLENCGNWPCHANLIAQLFGYGPIVLNWHRRRLTFLLWTRWCTIFWITLPFIIDQLSPSCVSCFYFTGHQLKSSALYERSTSLSRAADFPFWVVYKSISEFFRLIDIPKRGFDEIRIIMTSIWNRVGELFSLDPSSMESLWLGGRLACKWIGLKPNLWQLISVY